jgi:hypothetical protein
MCPCKKSFYLGTPNSFDLVLTQKKFDIKNDLQLLILTLWPIS